MNTISRRDALTGAALIAATSVPLIGTTAAPLVAHAALTGDPVLPAYEAYQAARLQCNAMSDHRLAIVKAVEAGMPPEPHPGRWFPDLSDAEHEEACAWRRASNRRVTARLGMDEDDFMDIHYDRVMLAYETVADIPATTVAGLLCQVRAWWSTYESHTNTGVPKLDPEVSPWEPQSVVQRLYHDVARLTGSAPS